MLIPDTIPDTEPILRVGIILPEDQEKTIRLDFSGSGGYSYYIDGKISFSSEKKYMEFCIEDGKLKADGFSCNKLIIHQKSDDKHILVKDVIAGRGFHWAKRIDVKLTYQIELGIMDGCIIVINELPIEEYLACVATSEMSSVCPDCYIEAQTIAARSWMLANIERKHTKLGFDVCNDDCCQRFQGVNNITIHSKNAALATKGRVLMYDKKIIDARYSKSCGGIMERFENLWENSPKEYMQNKADAPSHFNIDLTRENNFKNWLSSDPETFCSPHFIREEELHNFLGNVDEQCKYFRWTVEVTQEELVFNINEKLRLDVKTVSELISISRAGSGRLLELEIKYSDVNDMGKSVIIHKDYEIRRILYKKFLYSSAIIIEKILEAGKLIPSKFVYRGAGWGHGAGMCQIGGIGMALAGYKTEEILYHYYPGSVLKKIY